MDCCLRLQVSHLSGVSVLIDRLAQDAKYIMHYILEYICLLLTFCSIHLSKNHNELSKRELKYSMFTNNALFKAKTITLRHKWKDTFSAIVALHLCANEILLHLFTWIWICFLPVVVLYVNVILWSAIYCLSLHLFLIFNTVCYHNRFLFDLVGERVYRVPYSGFWNVTPDASSKEFSIEDIFF